MASALNASRVIALCLTFAAATSLAGCIGTDASCGFLGTDLYPVSGVGERLLAVEAGASETLLEAFGQSTFVLALELPDAAQRREYRMDFNAKAATGPGLYSSEFSWRGEAVRSPAKDPDAWHPFRIRLVTNSTDSGVLDWVFFGGDHVVEGRYAIAADRGSIMTDSADLSLPLRGGESFVQDKLQVGIRAQIVCS